MDDANYENLCRTVWALYEHTRHLSTVDGAPRNVLFPPPRRAFPVTLLIVGTSPNQKCSIQEDWTYDLAISFASRYEYILGGPTGNGYGKYYGELLNLVRRVDERLGVWWEVQQKNRQLLVEFTDALPIATSRGNEDLAQFHTAPLRARLKALLQAQLEYYAPRVVLGNGRFPSELLYELCEGKSLAAGPVKAVFPHCQFNCSVHLSGFIPGRHLDKFGRARLMNELRECWPSADIQAAFVSAIVDS